MSQSCHIRRSSESYQKDVKVLVTNESIFFFHGITIYFVLHLFCYNFVEFRLGVELKYCWLRQLD